MLRLARGKPFTLRRGRALSTGRIQEPASLVTRRRSTRMLVRPARGQVWQILEPLESGIQHWALHSFSHILTVLTLKPDVLFQQKLPYLEQSEDVREQDLFISRSPSGKNELAGRKTSRPERCN